MSKNAQPRYQLNVRFTGSDKAELLQNLDAYLSKYKITKADFIAQCIQHGIDNDLASLSPVVDSPSTSQVIQDAINEAITPVLQQIEELSNRLEEVESGDGEKEKLTPMPDSQLSGEEKHQLTAYRREIKELKQALESSRARQKEAEQIALQYQKDIAEIRKQGNGEMGGGGDMEAIREALPAAIAILREVLKIKNPTIRKLKSAIREFLTKITSSSDSQKDSHLKRLKFESNNEESWEDSATSFLDDMGMGEWQK